MMFMPWWIRYPNVNDEILNLDWLLGKVTADGKKLDEFINLNTIKYADPILWDITSQYEANTIVVDPQTGDAYISTKAVPYGVSLSNTDYWTNIYNYADSLTLLRKQIADADEGLSTTASAARAINDLVWLDGVLYIVTAPMIAGDSYVEGSNCEKKTVEEVIDLYANLIGNLSNLNTPDKSSIVNAINSFLVYIGDLTDLNTSDKTSVVNAINEVLTIVGNLSLLNTSDKTSIVNAINEVVNNMGDLSLLNTSDKTSIVNAINEVFNSIQNYSSLIKPTGDTTGATDLANIQSALNSTGYALLDGGDFYINAAIGMAAGYSVIGSGNNLTKLHVISDISAFMPKTVTTSVDDITISDMMILGVEPTNSTHFALDFNFVYDNVNYYGARYSRFENLDVRYFYGGFRGSQFWDTTFIKCRFATANTDVRLRDAVNNVTFIECVFNPDKYTWDAGGQVPIGAGIVADNGGRVECYNLGFYNCDCESRNVGYKLTTVLAAAFYNCYMERVNEGFNFDSCSNSLIKGGNINGCNIIARYDKTFSSVIYEGVPSIEDLFVKVNDNNTDKAYIVPTSAVGKVFIKNVLIINAGSGKCYKVIGDNNTFRTGQANARVIKHVVELPSIRYASQTYKAFIDNWGTTETFKYQGINLVVKKTFTNATATKLQLYRGATLLGEISIPAGTHNDGELLTADVGAVTLVNSNDFHFKLSTTCDVTMELTGIIRGYMIEDDQNVVGVVPTINV